MATTWLRQIHVNKGKTIAQTLVLRTDYAMNPEKTEGGELVASYGCSPRTADAEFLLAKREYEYITGRDNGRKNVLAYHLRQSFKPGEITPEEALDVGYETAMRWLKGKHAFIVAVHTDRAHVHCAVIYNSTTLDCTGKFNNFFGSSFALRRLSDTVCAEHGLSIVENPKPSRGQDYGKWLGDEKPVPFEEQIRRKIDEVLASCVTFDDFISTMRAAGFSVKDKRKHISICAPGQRRAWRLKTLGENYTEAAIRERVGMERAVSSGGAGGGPGCVSLLIDIQAKIREGSKGDGYKNWAHRFNIKQTAKTLLFLKENRIDSYDDLLKKSTAASNEFDGRVERIRAADNRLKEIAELQKQIGTYSKTREVYRQYTSLPPKKRGDFFEAHRADITLHQTAKKYFDGLGLKKLPTITALKQEYAALLAEKKKLYCGYKALKENHMALLNAKANAQRILGIGRGEHGGKTTIATERKHSLDM